MAKKTTKNTTSKKDLVLPKKKPVLIPQPSNKKPLSKYLKPTTDITFKKLFGTQERINLTKDFLNTMLEKKAGDLITTLTITDPANLPEAIDKKKSCVDVNCIDEAGKKYIIEMQVLNEYDFVERV